MLLAASSLTVIAARSADFQYYRFTPTHLRDDAAANSIQMSELGFMDAIGDLDLTGVTITNPGGRSPAAEPPASLIDGSIDSKWLDFNKAPVVIDFGTPTTVTGYFLATANDAPERDPLRWKLEGSADGMTWILLDEMTSDAAVPTERKTYTADFLLPVTPDSSATAWTGVVNASWNTTDANWLHDTATPWVNANFWSAVFPSGAPTAVTLTEPVSARALDFQAPGYTIAGDTLTLSGIPRIHTPEDATISSILAGTSGMRKTGGGTLTLTGDSAYSSFTSISSGTLKYAGAATKSTLGGLEVGIVDSTAVLDLSSSESISFSGSTGVGNGANATGVIRQRSGTTVFGDGGGINYLTIANGTDAFGALEISGGSISSAIDSGIRIGWNNAGTLVQTGGSLTANRWFAIGGPDATGVASFLGGTTTIASSWRLIAGDQTGAFGVINLGTMAGGDATLVGLRPNPEDGSILIGVGEATGYFNLNSGVAELSGSIYSGPGFSQLNANGGTVRAALEGVDLIKAGLLTVMQRGGMTVDTNGFNASLSADLVQPFGTGIYLTDGNLAVPSGGSGHVAAPLVGIESDSLLGHGAMAVANLTDGVVTSITLTAPGEDYEVGDTLTISFVGGGADTPAAEFEHVLTAADLDDSSQGDLVKTGAGTLTLSGTSDYIGATLVNEGTLAANGVLGTTSLEVAAGATLTGALDTEGPVTIHGAFAPGDGVGTATGTDGLTLHPGSTFAVEIADWTGVAGTGFDTASFDSLAIAATSGEKLTIEVDGTGIANFSESAASFVIASASSAPTGLTTDNWQVTASNFPGTGSWSLEVSGNDLVLSYEAGVGGYSTWVAEYPGLSDATPEGDPDMDGLVNLLEYVLDGDPTSGTQDHLPTGEIQGTDFVFSFVRRTDSKSDTTQVFEYGSDLVSWTGVPIPATSSGQVTIVPDAPAAGQETVTVTVPTSSAAGGKLFGRLTAARP
ncbi:hypothetical protein Hsar01_03761 [Haloferula sargassicola]|uniref:F5/8 type C domain-containing protein n=2 Tax=Haloferula sargassicola TaxID=490096 RepID=A0ABP9UUU1_9BACT